MTMKALLMDVLILSLSFFVARILAVHTNHCARDKMQRIHFLVVGLCFHSIERVGGQTQHAARHQYGCHGFD